MFILNDVYLPNSSIFGYIIIDEYKLDARFSKKTLVKYSHRHLTLDTPKGTENKNNNLKNEQSD